jgi:hypothetical protein
LDTKCVLAQTVHEELECKEESHTLDFCRLF